MSTINDSDLLLVERNGNLHQITYDQMSTLNDDDILLVERGGVQYKVEAQYVSTGPNGVILPSVEVLTPLNGAGLNDGQSYTPMSSAYVSTDTTPIWFRYFPVVITTVSGGSWTNENNIFDGNDTTYATLGGAAGVVSQATYLNKTQFGQDEKTVRVWAYASGGGTIEVLDENDSILRTYQLPTSAGQLDIGMVRFENKIRFTTTNTNENLYIAKVLYGVGSGEAEGWFADSILPSRVAFEFTDDTDLDKMVAPIIMTDENGNVKVPTTSTVDSTTTIPGENKDLLASKWYSNGSEQTYNSGDGGNNAPVGPRMSWIKENNSTPGLIADNVAINGSYLTTSNSNGKSSFWAPELYTNASVYRSNSGQYNNSGKYNYVKEIGVSPGILDIVSWTGDGTSLREIPHNLGMKPGMIIVKSTNNPAGWAVWHKDITPGYRLNLDTQGSQDPNANTFRSEPTKDAFYVGENGSTNAGGYEYVAYVYPADSPGKVKCGTYSGNGANQYIYFDFQPDFVLIKRTTGASDWIAVTTKTAEIYKYWMPNREDVSFYGNGGDYIGLSTHYFSLNGGATDYNSSGHEFIYLAVGANLTGPNSTQLNLLSGQDLEYFTTGTQITSNASASGSNISFSSNTHSGNGSLTFRMPNVSSNTNWFDITPATGNKWLVWIKAYSSSGLDHVLHDSERNYYERLETNRTNPNTYNDNKYILPHKDSSNSGYNVTPSGEDHNENNVNFISWNFLAAPQFFDVQKYVGTGSGTNKVISHDLGVEPGCIIVKGLSNDYNWAVYHSELAEGQYLFLNGNSPPSLSIGSFFVGADENTFTVGDSTLTSEVNKDFISYIFAKDTPYVKCGKYVGSGSGTSVNVGFKPRWVMIKNISEAFDWMILDKNIPSNKTLSPNTTSQSVALANGYQFTSNGFSFGGSDLETNHSTYEYVYIAIADESEGHPPSPPSTSTVTETPDPNTAQMVVNAESFDVGATASAPALEASITQIAGADGNRLIVDASTGTWMPGLYAKGTETTIDAPGPDEITFTSQNQGTPAFSGVDATLASRTWTLESGTTSTGPWTLVDTYVDYDVLNSQTGATPWTSNKPNLSPNTFYRIKVQYNSTNAESVESVYNTFKTGDA